jgi:hypothetical protein
MKKILPFLIAVVLVGTACHKYTTPKNVTRILTQGTWKVARMVDKNKNITDSLADIRLTFSQDSLLTVQTSDSIYKGTWDIPTNAKKPVNLTFYIPDSTRAQPLSDDWNVIYKAKEELHLERLDGKKGEDDELILRRL